MPVPRDSLRHTIERLTVGHAISMRKRDARDREMGFAEIQQQYQIPVFGTAGPLPGFVTVDIAFDYPFHYAPGQRDSDLDRPHMWFGGECDGDVLLGATVKSWDINDANGAIIGATVRLAAFGSIVALFSGVVHVTFQGYAALAETETDIQ